MSGGPIVAALAGAPAGSLVDRFGAHRMGIVGLLAMALGAIVLPLFPQSFGMAGYICPCLLYTSGLSSGLALV